MNNDAMKELCLALICADTESEVIDLLKEHNLWDDPDLWRYYGDNESNYSTIGNQQSRAEAALVEKLVNSVDARLMGACLRRGIDPESDQAPKSIREAVAQFFDPGTNPSSSTAGLLVDWPTSLRLEVARGSTLTVTGQKPRQGYPSITISDSGEGQTPGNLPTTILSLHRQNKLRIAFVQGKFCQGGSGALNFCGKHKLQLVVSRRDPQILNGSTGEGDANWGFTVVRREQRPNTRISVFTFLAPLRTPENPTVKSVLSFPAERLQIFPEANVPYARSAEWGTLIKLYEYQLPRSGPILLRDGLLARLDLLLPEVALPIRLHECRDYKGKKGSFATNLAGFRTRLEDDKAENLEFAPSSSPISISGEQMTATIYAFKKGKTDAYRSDEGIIFTVNGQTHGHLTTDFFRRKKVGLSYLRDSVLVVLDCSQISQAIRDDLFMTSRDRVRENDFSREIKKVLEDLLHGHPGLRALKERRRREEIEEKVSDDKPLEDVLRTLLKDTPALSRFFLKGTRLASPFKSKKVAEDDSNFEGRRFPSFFQFKGKNLGTKLERDCHINMRARVVFETDAENEYFSRDVDPGRFQLYQVFAGNETPVQDYVLNLQSGIAILNVRLPANCQEGDVLPYQALVSDVSQPTAFNNVFRLNVKAPAKPGGGTAKKRKKPSKSIGEERLLPTGIALPRIREVPEDEWGEMSPPFVETTALRIKHAGTVGESEADNGEGPDIYDFYINRDNIHLKTFLKAELTIGADESKLVRAQFRYGLVLLGLALIQRDTDEAKRRAVDDTPDDSDNDVEANIEEQVESFCTAAAAVLLPLIRSLGELDIDAEKEASEVAAAS